MLCARLTEPGEPLSIEEVPDPKPAAGEVLVRVEACGVCASDLHFWHGHVRAPKIPVILGHEVAGTIEAIGDGVSDEWSKGMRVAVHPAAPCGECELCRAGRESICRDMEGLGMHRDGGYAELVAAPVRSLVKVPDDLPLEQAAVATDAVATAFHALACRGRLQAGESVAVFGCGGLGTHALLLARLMGAGKIVAVDTKPSALMRAPDFGAHDTVDATGGEAGREVRSRGGVDLALDFVGVPETVGQAMKSLKRGGRCVVVGVGMKPLQLAPSAILTSGEYELRGCYGSERRDLKRVLELAGLGVLDLSRSVSATFSLSDANKALAALESKADDPIRLVLAPG